ncbi:MAG TPA: hypothetical protein VJI66_01825 [Candidatus Paceibacterota bacterium]
MRNYSIISPSVDGIISDDHLYFEGVQRPQEVYLLRDGGASLEEIGVLEKYFNDVYNLFLRKLSSFAMFGHTDDEETTKLQALLQELIKVKKLLGKGEEENLL